MIKLFTKDDLKALKNYLYRSSNIPLAFRGFCIFKNLCPFILVAACTVSPKDDDRTIPPSLYQQPKTIPANPKGGYAINPLTGDSIKPFFTPLGDTFVTGIPIATEGKRIHPDSVSKPKVIKIPPLNSLKKYNAYPNQYTVPDKLPVFPVDASKLTKKMIPQVPKGDTSHYLLRGPGQKVLTGFPIPSKGKKVQTIHPKPVQALPPALKDVAIPYIQYLEVEQGMVDFRVRSVLQDKKGNLWFGTDGGVSKYDGQYFTNFTEKEGLISNLISSILEDKKGNIWFGSCCSGVCKYDGQSFTHFTTNEGLTHNSIRSMVEDKNGNIWFGTDGGGVCKYDGDSFTNFTEKEGLSNNSVYSIAEDKNRNLWFGTNAGVSIYDGNSLATGQASFTHFTEKEGLRNNSVISIAEDKNGNLWFGTGVGGVSKFNIKSLATGKVSVTHFTEKEGFTNKTISSIAEDKNGNLWFGINEGGIIKYNGISQPNGQTSFTHYTEKEGLSNNFTLALEVDHCGNLWIGTWAGGVSKFDVNSLTLFTEKQGLSSNLVCSMLEDHNGYLWFGTNGSGVNKYDGKSFTHFAEKEGFIGGHVLSIVEDKNGNIWFGTNGNGVIKYDGMSFTNYTTKEGLSQNSIQSTLVDKNGNLWLGTIGGGITKYNGESFTHFTRKEGFISNTIFSIAEDKNGNLWFGTSGSGVSKYDGKFFTPFTQKEGLSGNRVGPILEDKKGNLWFGIIDVGVSKYDGKSFTHFAKKDGLGHHQFGTIEEDKNGHIWFGSGGGGVNIYNGKLFGHFTRKEGLSNNTIWKILEDKNGHIWVCTEGGVNKMMEDALQPSPQPLEVHLRQLYINEALPDYRNPSDSSIQKIKFDSVQAFENYPINPKIPSGQNHLGFQFSAIDWSAPTKIKYSFRLLGLDNKWSAPSAKTMAEYRNLPHGKFVFQICAIGIGGKWSQPFEYTFTINPPWWHTWWFRSLMLAAFVSAIFAYIKYRTHSLLKRQQFLQSTVEKRTEELRIALSDKEALLKEIHHRVKNNLEVISSLLTMQTKVLTDDGAKAALAESQSRVQSIALIHHKLYRTDDLGSVELVGFSKDLFKQIKDVFNQPGTKVDFYINETEIWLNTDAAVPFGLIFNELITNAFKYGVAATSENLFTMHATSKEEENTTHYHFVFRDNGPGLPDNFSLEKTSSLGMKVIRLLTKQLDGTSKFYNDNGTVFELQFSKRNLPS